SPRTSLRYVSALSPQGERDAGAPNLKSEFGEALFKVDAVGTFDQDHVAGADHREQCLSGDLGRRAIDPGCARHSFFGGGFTGDRGERADSQQLLESGGGDLFSERAV